MKPKHPKKIGRVAVSELGFLGGCVRCAVEDATAGLPDGNLTRLMRDLDAMNRRENK